MGIYLVKTSAYLESMITDYYAKDDDGIKKIVIQEEKLFGKIIDKDSIDVDFKNKEIRFKTRYDWDDEFEDKTYYFEIINPIS